ncbi:uncharacterized protein SPPG_08927 [Spizellomyces punctatus DAOM BR117]|uniref:HYDIN/VesB/CFA65-like Ig-like domain-containing protein n=1 Tax=Spizellomyces punctatus (strain DAOM BR117) TaxID=645134 RepID=A0A0L0HRX5_SPIPD|nr:uncharacterized protein SPPG_08927 [Spizellomyces punctatus DAOM BR117]KND03878.1 hypothetical protein SPPG_08927 [Spizellomyces punctatus DAOM BR117]|eukprot:XP_016611917.1 hypothetical protein SPPG_08927 [Spizellomyces punctatus DAOM BR117]
MENRPPGDRPGGLPPDDIPIAPPDDYSLDDRPSQVSEHVQPIRGDREAVKRKTRAQKLWDLLKAHVQRGFFHSLLNTRAGTSSDFLTLVDRLWTLVHLYSPKSGRQTQKDSTTEFVMAGWARIKAEQHALERQRARAVDTGMGGLPPRRQSLPTGSLHGAGMSADQDVDRGVTMPDTISEEREQGYGPTNTHLPGLLAGIENEEDKGGEPYPTAPGRRGLGLEGLNLDSIPSINVSKDLMQIAKGLHVQPLDEADFYTVQVHFNRGWKLLLLGLNQAESFARYMAMVALRRAIPMINDTLLDSTTRESLIRVLVNLMVSDERTENRLKAVYLLGQLGFYLGAVREHDHLLMLAFKELVRRLLEIQYKEKRKPANDPDRFSNADRALKIYLLHAIGKFTRFVHKQSRFAEDVVMYILHEEFDKGDSKVKQPVQKTGIKEMDQDPSLHVVRALLGVLNNEMKRTDANHKYVGAIFKKYVHPLMRSTDQSLQMMAVQFISNWLPIMNDDAILLGIDTVISGLKETKDLHVPNFDRAMYDAEYRALVKRTRSEESRMAMRSKLLRQLLQVPGTFARLVPVPDHPGFFVEVNSSMMYTKGVAVNLPIHPKSSVTLTRPLPSIPGVPQGGTTIPPVFMDPLWAEKQKPPQYRYEYLERTGEVPGLPYGYTCAPAPLVEVNESATPDQASKEIKGTLKAAADVLSQQPGTTLDSGRFSARPGPPDARAVRRAALQAVDTAPMAASARKGSVMAMSSRRVPSGNRPTSSSRPRRASTMGSANAGDLSMERARSRSGSQVSLVPKKRAGIKDRGPIPPGTARVPQKSDLNPYDGRRVPPGFLNICPFPGYDPDRVDRAALPVSAIYGKQMGPGRGPPGVGSMAPAKQKAIIDARPGFDVPEGFTVDRHPVLWPSRIPNLRSMANPTDFPINAPVLFDIIQPGTTHLQRVMTRVTSINKEMAAVSVQREANEDEMLSVGATFNIFIRTRQNPSEWISVNLEVVDDDYVDDIGFSKPRPLGTASGASSLASLVNIKDAENRSSMARRTSQAATAVPAQAQAQSTVPLPAGFTSQGEPYFAPPINMPPFPVGYTINSIPYFGRTSTIKPPPLGMTSLGTRFYSADGKPPGDQASRNHLAGYDNSGHPFFIPRGCTVPPPAGFTTDGIAYYDIFSLMHHRGVMVLPTPLAARAAWPVFEDEEEDAEEDGSGSLSRLGSTTNLTRRGSRAALRRKTVHAVDQALLTAQLVESLEESQPQLKQNFLKGRQRAVGVVRRVAEFERLRGKPDSEDIDEELNLQDPEDIVGFLRDSEDLAYLRPSTIRVNIEPSVLDFQSVHAPVTKAAVLRYRAGRGDYGERDFFVSVEPVDVFAIKLFHLKLQGEGVMEIGVTYYPTAMKTDRVEGSLNLIDDSGKKMGSCSMVALRQSFIKVSPISIDAGWTLPDRRKEVYVKLENISSGAAMVTIQLHSELQAYQAESPTGSTQWMSSNDEKESISKGDDDDGAPRKVKAPPFVLPVRQLKLQPHESKTFPVYFEPTKLGHFADVVEINGPGGDLIHVKITGIAGIPIAVYPEGEENSRAGAAELTRERCEFMRKFRRADSKEKLHVGLTAEDTAILKNMMSATSDQESRKEAHTMDFGICSAEPHERMRCLTLMNLADVPVTVGLFPHHPALRCPYLVRIAPRMANTVEVFFTVSDGPPAVRGNLRTAIEVICPEFQNIPLNIRAYIGQPLFFPSWEYAFFKPCRINRQEQLTMTLINESQYRLQLVVDNLGLPGGADPIRSYFGSTLSSQENDPTVIMPHSTIPVAFTFFARERGPLLQTIQLRVVKPFNVTLPAAFFNKPFSLIGICIEPYVHRPGELPDRNSIDFLRMWMSHPKRLLDEYPTPEEKAQRFDLAKPTKPYTPGNNECDVTFARDPVSFRAGVAKTPVGQMTDAGMRRSQLQPILVQNRGSQSRNIIFFTSTCFSIDPRAKMMQPADAENVDVMFLPPIEASELVSSFGFAVALLDHDHTFHAIQLQGKPLSDFLVFPPPGKDHTIVLDFGRVEVSTHSLDINVKHVVLCNSYDTTYSWNVKFVSSKQKFSAFDAGMIMGELQTYETFAIPFRFHCDTSGSFETMAEIYIKETLDRLAKPSKIVTVILRGQTVNTSMGGLPDTLDFGSTVVFQKKRRKFMLANNGSTEAQVTILSRPPFDVTPKTFPIAPKGQQEIQVTYTPTESRTSQVKMLVFSNHKLYLILLTGTGGTAELICEKYENKDVDFGYQREGTVGWLSLYLTNKGTLPLTLKAVTADNLDLVKLEYLTVTSTVPYEANRGPGRNLNNVIVRRDYWSILKRKLEVFTVLKQLLAGTTGVKKSKAKGRRQDGPSEEEGKQLRIHRTDSINPTDHVLVPQLPQLRPFYSYHFRLGYTSRYQAKKDTSLIFHYMPITTDEEADTISALVKRMSVHVVGNVYRPLELYPPYHDFGLAPAEAYILPEARRMVRRELADAYGVMREGQKEGEAVLQLEVLNMSLEAQNLTLQSISTEFTVNGRTWTLQPGDKITIPMEFHPPKEQVQYHGEARFVHNFGTALVRLAGTGASADLSTEEVLDFGSLKVGSIGSKTLRLHNRGLLDCRYVLEIVQPGQDFTLLDEEPFDREGVIESGGVESLEVECNCERLLEGAASIVIRWLRVPRGAWEELVIPLLVQVGMPVFRLQNMELDFHTTYINVNKTMEFTVTNDGNATCNWEAETESPVLVIEPEGGSLQPGETVYLEVTFAPQDFDPLHHNINFYTDAGTKTLMCYGIVGVPYLKIPEEDMFMDFGIVAINKPHNHSVVFTNTGKRHIEFEITLIDVTHDGIEMAPEDFDVFFINPTHDIIEPGGTVTITMQTIPREYNAIYAGEWMVRTRDGEQYRGRLTATGGKAIIKLAPPTLAAEEALSKKPKTAEMSMNAPSSRGTEASAGYLPSTVETARQTFQNHLDNLQEVLAGLRAAELDTKSELESVLPKPPTADRPVSTPRSASARRRQSVGTPDIKAEDANLEESRQRGLRVMDGSDVRDRARRGTAGRVVNIDNEDLSDRPRTGRRSRTARGAIDADSSAAVRYMDELSQLEDELDMAIGLRDPLMSPIATGAPGTPSKRTPSGLGRYQPGAPRHRRPQAAREAVIRSILSASGERSSERDSEESLRTGSRASERLSNRKSVASSAEMERLQRPIEDLIQTAQEMISDANNAVDPNVQRTLLSAANDRILDSTRGVIKAVKEQLANAWIENRDFLTTALRRLQQSTHVMEALGEAPLEKEAGENDFNLGLLKAGERSAPILLFNLPNLGNLAFDFHIKRKEADAMFPPDFVMDNAGDVFVLDPPSGAIAPRESVNISATFTATTPGTYQQAYELISGGEVVLTFTATARVGSPNLVISPATIDFGLVGRQKSSVRTFHIENTGTYKDIFRIEAVVAAANLEAEDSLPTALPFVLSTYRGDVEPGASEAVQVTFSAPQEGTYVQRFRVAWSKEPLFVECKGVGGGYRIKPVFMSEKDQQFGGLDWGTCVVGVSYEKLFKLTNIGNVEGTVDLFHSNDCFRFDVVRDAKGAVHIPPGQEVDVKMIFWPSRSETIKEGVQVRLPENNITVIPVRAITGITEWKVDGDAKLLNMPVLEIQNRTLKVTNTGNLEIPLEVRIEPPELAAIVGVKVLNWKEGEALKPNQTASVDLTVAPQKAALIEGTLIITTNLGKGPVQNKQPFKLRAYEEQLGVDNDEDASVGRIMIGDIASVSRTLTNYGSSRIKYRVRIEPVVETEEVDAEKGDSGKKTKRGRRKGAKAAAAAAADKGKTWAQLATPWKIKGAAEGILEANQTLDFEAIFQSLDEDDDWQEAKLIIEKCADETTQRWTEVTSFKVLGAGGNPKLTVTPSEIDFKDAGIGITRKSTVIFKNEGSAIVNYQVIPQWDWDSVINFDSDATMEGKLDPDQEIPFTILFKPDQHAEYVTEIQIKTQIDVKILKIRGQGAEYKIYAEGLPEVVDYGSIAIGESETKKLVISNDCPYGIQVKGTALKTQATEGDSAPEIVPELQVTPDILDLPANRRQDERSSESFILRLQAAVPLNEDGSVDAQMVTHMVRKGQRSAFFHLMVLGGQKHIVPLVYKWSVKQPVALVAGATPREGGRFLESDKLKQVDFGEVRMDSGSAIPFLIHNPNGFAIRFNATCNEKQFKINPDTGSISPHGSKEFTCELTGYEFKDDATVPQSETFNGIVNIFTDIEAIDVVSITTSGTLVDEPLPLEPPEPLDFGPVQSLKASELTFAFRNPVRRPIKWKFHVDPQFADIFGVDGITEGVAAPRQETTIKMKFKPQHAADYIAAGYLETEEGSYPVQLQGTGVDPAVVLDKRYEDFGVVGMGNPEFREIEIKNPTLLPLRVGARTTSPAFTTDVTEMTIAPGETRKVKVFFNPAVIGESQRGRIAFVNLDDIEEEPSSQEDEKEGANYQEEEAAQEARPPRDVHTPRTRPFTGKERILDQIELQGAAGEFGFSAVQIAEDNLSVPSGEAGEGNAIRLNFPKIPERQRVRKHFEVENVGDTVIDLGVADENGEALLEEGERFSDSTKVSYKISPVTAQIRPKTRQNFTVIVKGLKPGEDKFDLTLRTRTLAAPKSIPIKVTAKVVGAMELLSESLSAFVRADNSIEAMIDYQRQEEFKYGGDTDVWKVLLPIIRVSALLPSQDLSLIPMLEPHVAEPGIEAVTVRPPAVPRELPPRAKKWYMNRVSMALDQGNRVRADAETPEMQRRQEAAQFIQPVEKKVFLERTARR